VRSKNAALVSCLVGLRAALLKASETLFSPS
jgi:hypothetical protein